MYLAKNRIKYILSSSMDNANLPVRGVHKCLYIKSILRTKSIFFVSAEESIHEALGKKEKKKA